MNFWSTFSLFWNNWWNCRVRGKHHLKIKLCLKRPSCLLKASMPGDVNVEHQKWQFWLQQRCNPPSPGWLLKSVVNLLNFPNATCSSSPTTSLRILIWKIFGPKLGKNRFWCGLDSQWLLAMLIARGKDGEFLPVWWLWVMVVSSSLHVVVVF